MARALNLLTEAGKQALALARARARALTGTYSYELLIAIMSTSALAH